MFRESREEFAQQDLHNNKRRFINPTFSGDEDSNAACMAAEAVRGVAGINILHGRRVRPA
jgi:hypothetical protein